MLENSINNAGECCIIDDLIPKVRGFRTQLQNMCKEQQLKIRQKLATYVQLSQES